jgi:hypothetical protein
MITNYDEEDYISEIVNTYYDNYGEIVSENEEKEIFETINKNTETKISSI